jgi:glycosyltransferase involved in cell wall biosynthesis
MARRKVNVLVCGSSKGEYGGIEAVMFTLAKYLDEQPDYGAELAFKLTRGAAVRASLESWLEGTTVKTAVVNRMSPKLFAMMLRADVIHTQNVPPDIIAFAKLLGKPLISITHNYLKPGRDAHTLLWQLGRLLCDAITYNSRFVQQTWNRSAFKHVRTWVIPTLAELPEPISPGGERMGFAFISRWIPNKGADLLIEAYSKANFDKSLWPLVMMGDGPLRKPLEEHVAKHQYPGIKILGRVTEQTKCEQISRAKWAVVPPNTNEDMGLTPIEARIMGTPVIASNDGGVPESAGKWSRFFQKGSVDALKEALESVTMLGETDYLKQANASQLELKNYLKPLSIYLQIYAATGWESIPQSV